MRADYRRLPQQAREDNDNFPFVPPGGSMLSTHNLRRGLIVSHASNHPFLGTCFNGLSSLNLFALFTIRHTQNGGTDRRLMNSYWQRGWVEVHMNRRDQELLDRQMRRFQPLPNPVGLMMLIVAVAFFVGMIAGSIIFPSQQPVQSASTDGRTALAFLLNGSRTEPR